MSREHLSTDESIERALWSISDSLQSIVAYLDQAPSEKAEEASEIFRHRYKNAGGVKEDLDLAERTALRGGKV